MLQLCKGHRTRHPCKGQLCLPWTWVRSDQSMHANPPLGLTTSACSVKLRRACIGMDEPCQSRNRDKSADCNNRCHRARQRSGVNATSLKHRRVLRWYSWLNVPIFNVPASMSPLRHEAHGARARTCALGPPRRATATTWVARVCDLGKTAMTKLCNKAIMWRTCNKQ